MNNDHRIHSIAYAQTSLALAQKSSNSGACTAVGLQQKNGGNLAD